MTEANENKLSRTIPEHIKRQIRQACGFGCAICGNAFYHYEHIEPFHSATLHDPQKMTLLCGGCHDKVTRGIWSKDKVRQAAANPKCSAGNWSTVSLDIGEIDDLVIKIGQTIFIGLSTVISIDGIELFSVERPNADNEPPLISARFFDRNNNEIGRIEKNEWFGSHEVFDIQTIGSQIKVRSAKRDIDLVLSMRPPRELHIERINLRYNGKSISGDSNSGFKVTTLNAEIVMPSSPEIVGNAPYWLSINDQTINVGAGKLIRAIDTKNCTILPGVMFGATNASIKVGTAEEFDLPGYPLDKKLIKLTSNAEGVAVLELGFQVSETPKTPQWPLSRNSPCPCGSKARYKHCCGRLA